VGLGAGLGYRLEMAEGGGEERQHGVAADLILKASGFDLFLGVYLMKKGTEDPEFGATLQGGYFLTPKKNQVALRGSFIPSATHDGQALEIRAAYNMYFQGHNWKWATDLGVLQNTGDNLTAMGPTDKPDFQLRTMAQMSF